MRIKTLKIKVESPNQEFEISDYFNGSNTLYTTVAQLVQEEDGFYWHAFITYKPQAFVPLNKSIESTKKEQLPDGFEDAIRDFVKKQKDISKRSVNRVLSGLDQLLNFSEISDFKSISNLGDKTISDDLIFFENLLLLIKTFKSNEQ